jgi:Recombination endonuclease VII
MDLTREQYDEWRSRQNGHCKLCGHEISGKSAHTDHDHETGQLRDMLCYPCNQGLGCFKDDPGLLRAAADYIERHRVLAMVT